MIILDTDHISVLQHEDSPKTFGLLQKLKPFPSDEVATTVVTLEEQSRSWLGLIGRYTDVRQQVEYYDRLRGMFDFFSDWQVLRRSESAAEEFRRLRQERVRIASSDLKIASIALVNGATLQQRPEPGSSFDILSSLGISSFVIPPPSDPWRVES